MPVPLTGSTALVPMSRLWRPMARTDRNRERRAPGTPAPTCSPTICRGVRSDKYRSSLGLLARRWPPRSAGCRPRPKQPGARETGADLLRKRHRLVEPTGHVGVPLEARRASPVAGIFDAQRRRRLARIFWRYIAMVRAGISPTLPVIAAIAAARWTSSAATSFLIPCGPPLPPLIRYRP